MWGSITDALSVQFQSPDRERGLLVLREAERNQNFRGADRLLPDSWSDAREPIFSLSRQSNWEILQEDGHPTH